MLYSADSPQMRLRVRKRSVEKGKNDFSQHLLLHFDKDEDEKPSDSGRPHSEETVEPFFVIMEFRRDFARILQTCDTSKSGCDLHKCFS